MLRGRTHRARILGIGHQRSRGIKGGVVIDMEEAEASVRLAVDAAERMAKVQVESVIVANAGGRSARRVSRAACRSRRRRRGRPASRAGGHRLRTAQPGRAILHSLPNGFSLDGAGGIRDPRGMMGERLGADLHVVSADPRRCSNLMLAVERCHWPSRPSSPRPMQRASRSSWTTRPARRDRARSSAAAPSAGRVPRGRSPRRRLRAGRAGMSPWTSPRRSKITASLPVTGFPLPGRESSSWPRYARRQEASFPAVFGGETMVPLPEPAGDDNREKRKRSGVQAAV